MLASVHEWSWLQNKMATKAKIPQKSEPSHVSYFVFSVLRLYGYNQGG